MRVLFTLAASSLCISSCGWYYSTISIENRSSDDAIDVQIVNGDKRFSIFSVARGESESFWQHFSGEGAPFIVVSASGRAMIKELCYYTGSHTFDAVVVVTDNNIEVRCE